jgi:hypothetical protein
MSVRTAKRNNEQVKSPASAAKRARSEDWGEQFEHSSDPESVVTRMRASETFQVSFSQGVDVLAAHARAFFDAIPPGVVAITPGTDDREVFRFALEICTNMVALAFMDGRRDLEPIKRALQAGRVALAERNRGFDEPLFRARKRLPGDPRERFCSLQLKTWCAMACTVLIYFGDREHIAAKRVADLLSGDRFNEALQPKSGKSAKSVLNWRERWTRGDLLKFTSIQVTTGAGCFWRMTRIVKPEGDVFRLESLGLFREFPKACTLWRADRPEAARKAVLGELTDRLEEIRRSASVETSPPV